MGFTHSRMDVRISVHTLSLIWRGRGNLCSRTPISVRESLFTQPQYSYVNLCSHNPTLPRESLFTISFSLTTGNGIYARISVHGFSFFDRGKRDSCTGYMTPGISVHKLPYQYENFCSRSPHIDTRIFVHAFQ